MEDVRPVSVVEVGYGDPVAFYRREHASAVRLAVALVDVTAIAEDLVQEAFARVWERWDRIDVPAAYLRVCLVNLCRRELRRRVLLRRRQTEPADSAPVARDEPRLLLDAIRALPSRRRAVVVLRFYEDLSEAETAKLLHIRPSTVRSTLHQALAQLREVIER